jgi:hypothetical protein
MQAAQANPPAATGKGTVGRLGYCAPPLRPEKSACFAYRVSRFRSCREGVMSAVTSPISPRFEPSCGDRLIANAALFPSAAAQTSD